MRVSLVLVIATCIPTHCDVRCQALTPPPTQASSSSSSDVTEIAVVSNGNVQQSNINGIFSSSGTADSTSSGSANFIPVVIAGIAAGVVLMVVVAVVVVRRRSQSPAPFVLGAGIHDPGDDWANPIYSAPARSVAFDNPIYDRLEDMA